MKKYIKVTALFLAVGMAANVMFGGVVSKDRAHCLVTKEQLKQEKNFNVPKVNKLSKPTNLKVYRSTEAALVSWMKVEGAQYYIVSRKQGKNGKWKMLGKVYEKNFVKSTYKYHVREFVDIRYKNSKKKKSMNYKGRKYLYYKNYTYRVRAVNRKVKSGKVTKYSKKWKKKKTELSYYTLYLTNKLRRKKKLCNYVWGHAYEKGSLVRAEEVKKQVKKFPDGIYTDGVRDAWHYRPNGDYYGSAFAYQKKMFSYETQQWITSAIRGEDVGYSVAGTTKDVFDSYTRSRGHLGILIDTHDEIYDCTGSFYSDGVKVSVNKGDASRFPFSLTAATCSKNLLSTSDNKDSDVYHELVIGYNELVYNFEQYN